MSLVEDGKVVANTTTDENGLYSFENVLPGTYTINDPVPRGLVLTTSSTVTVTVKRCGDQCQLRDVGPIPYPA